MQELLQRTQYVPNRFCKKCFLKISCIVSKKTNLLFSCENVQLHLSDDAAPQEVILEQKVYGILRCLVEDLKILGSGFSSTVCKLEYSFN